jgi:hypothetical protein
MMYSRESLKKIGDKIIHEGRQNPELNLPSHYVETIRQHLKNKGVKCGLRLEHLTEHSTGINCGSTFQLWAVLPNRDLK